MPPKGPNEKQGFDGNRFRRMLEHWRFVGATVINMHQLILQPTKRTLLAAHLILGLASTPGCGDKPTSKAAMAAPTKGVVGKVLSVRGTVTYSVDPGTKPKPLTPGMDLRAEWTVHTGRGAEVTARLTNGHLWVLSGDLTKRITKIRALTLAPVKQGAVAQLSDLGAIDGKDRSAAAGLHQERTAGSKAAPTRAPRLDKEHDLNERTKPPTDARPPNAVTATPKTDPAPIVRRPAPRTRLGKRKAQRRPPKTGGTRVRHYNRRPRGNAGAPLGIGPSPGTSSRSMGPTGGGATETKALPGKDKDGVKASPKKLTRSQVSRVLHRLRSRMTTCLKTHKVTTAIVMRLVIRGVDGRVTAVHVKGRSSGDKVVRCLLSRAQAIRFPKFSAARQTLRSIRLKAP